MRKELSESEVEVVTGGTVFISAPMGLTGFTTLGKMYKIKGDVKEMRNLLLKLYDENENMNERAFDELVEAAFLERGWI